MTRLILGPIIGGVSSRSAYLWGRCDGPATLYAWLGKDPDLSDARLAGQSLPVEPATGFAGVAPLQDLSPNQPLLLRLNPERRPTPPARRVIQLSARSRASGSRHSFAFAFGSCFRPADENGGQIFHSLEERQPGG